MTLAELILPKEVLTYFTVVSIEQLDQQIDISLDELANPPSSSGYHYLSKGFTEATVIQDFPIRGNAVFLHIRRRKWYEQETGKIITSVIDLSHSGTQLTQEFASFLKRKGSNPDQYR